MRWNWWVKIKLLAVLGGTLALFAWLGFWVIGRTDPLGPLLLLDVPRPGLAVMLLVGMSALCGMVGGLVLQRDLPYAGWLVVGVGWMGLAFRSPGLSNLLIYYPSGGATGGGVGQIHLLYLRVFAELLLLAGITVLAQLLSHWINLLRPTLVSESDDQAEASPSSRRPSASPGRPVLDPEAWAQRAPVEGRKGRRADSPEDQQPRQRPDSMPDLLSNFVAAGLSACLLFILLIDKSADRGQLLFAIAGAFFLAGLAAHQVFPTRTPLAMLAGVVAVAAVSYLLAAITGNTSARVFGYQAPLVVAAPLPIDYLGFGLPAVVAAYWISCHLLNLRAESMMAEPASADQRNR